MNVLSSLAAQLGPGSLDVDETTLRRYQQTTLPYATTPLGVVYPQSTDEVKTIVEFARFEKIALHPISRGKNWGYGEAMSPLSQSLIVDLSRMNRILEVNESLAYVVIEPGVTQSQLHAHLEKLGTLWMDGNGAGPNASLVGNILERGFGHTPLGERCNQICGMEVVLGSGEVLRTGFGHYPNAKAERTYRHGVGPALDGLFFQSNYGIVTQLGYWVMPKPESFVPFSCTGPDPSDIATLVTRIGQLRRSGVLKSTVHIFNTLRSLTNRVAYPWNVTEGRQPVPVSLRAQWAKEYGVGAWGASGAIYGPRSVTAASFDVIRETLLPLTVTDLSPEGLSQMPKTQADGFLPVIGLLRGEPTEFYLRSAAWRSPSLTEKNCDPIANGAGLIWIVPTLPATPQAVKEVETILEEVMHHHGFDVPITFTFINDRTLTCTTNINFNREDESDARAAWQCYRELVPRLIAEGYPPYRSGVGGYDLLKDESSFWKTALAIKKTLDPDGILSPGHYLT